MVIIESVDSICRDTTDTQYMLIQKISPNLRNGTLISRYNHIRFIFKCFHDQQDSSRRCESTTQVLAKWVNCFSFFFLSFFFRRASSTSPQSLMRIFARNSSILHRAVHQPIAFLQPQSLHQAAAAAHSITMASFFTPFSRSYACTIS